MLHHHLIGLKQEMQGMSKLDSISNKECRYMHSYMLEKSLEDSRLEFRWRTHMLKDRLKSLQLVKLVRLQLEK